MQCNILDRLVFLVNKQSVIRGFFNSKQSISYLAIPHESKSLLKTSPNILYSPNRTYFVTVRNQQKTKAKGPENASDSLVENSKHSSVSTHLTGVKRGSF
jgi:hypothetical protein